MKFNNGGNTSKTSKQKEVKINYNKDDKLNLPKKVIDNIITENISNYKLSLEDQVKIFKKSKDILEFNCLSHLKENISHTDKNSIYPLNDKSYYCINCKHSNCPLYNKDKNQKEHLLKKKEKYLFFNNNIFSNIESSLNEALKYKNLKSGLKDCINSTIESLKDELDKLKNKKFKEVDDFFDETDKYIQDLNKKYINMKQEIENFYKINEEFFNIEFINETNSKNNKGSSVTDNKDEKIEQILDEIEIGNKNRDLENTTFLIHFEIMNLCENRNLEIIYLLQELKKKSRHLVKI